MCGEHWVQSGFDELDAGSSPHVRGAPVCSDQTASEDGIIPACAGSTVGWVPCQVWCRDHPRMCGEHWNYQTWTCWSWGSSPHVRGAPTGPVIVQHACGIIPACAGSTLEQVARRIGQEGSSPHVRGAQVCVEGVLKTPGIIPACAGSTLRVSIVDAHLRDHPRMCGEHAIVVSLSLESEGSSPHVRGAHLVHGHFDDGTGIIPACAGSTWYPPAESANPRDHPRMCGEHTSKIA